MATERADADAVYEVYCRGCEWGAEDPVDLKGEANLLAGRHISETGHVVVVKTVTRDEDDPGEDFYRGRGRRVSFERLRPLQGDPPVAAEVRTCGPVECLVESG